MLYADGEIRNPWVTESGIHVADSRASCNAGAEVAGSDRKTRWEKIRELGIRGIPAGRRAEFCESGRTKNGRLFRSTNRREKDQGCLGVIQAPSCADNGRMFSAANIPGEAKTRTPLIEVVRNTLGRRNHLAGAALADPNRVSGNRGLRLWVPGAVPTETVGQSYSRSELPLILPIETGAGLIVVEKRVGLEEFGKLLLLGGSGLPV